MGCAPLVWHTSVKNMYNSSLNWSADEVLGAMSGMEANVAPFRSGPVEQSRSSAAAGLHGGVTATIGHDGSSVETLHQNTERGRGVHHGSIASDELASIDALGRVVAGGAGSGAPCVHPPGDATQGSLDGGDASPGGSVNDGEGGGKPRGGPSKWVKTMGEK